MKKQVVLFLALAIIISNEVMASEYSVVEFPVCTASGNQIDPDISGNTVVWEDYRNGNCDIYSYNIVTEQEKGICLNTAAHVLVQRELDKRF